MVAPPEPVSCRFCLAWIVTFLPLMVMSPSAAISKSSVSWNVAFFAFNGVVIDGLYRVEARLFGASATLGTVLKKTAFDQLVFNPVWLALIIAIYAWRGQAFRLRATVSALRAGGPFYRTRVVPLLLPMWCFWIPMVLIIYALPVPLQFLLFVLALGACSSSATIF